MASKPYHLDVEAPIRVIDCEKAFNCLDIREKNYAYYFTRASWEGQKVCYFSKSYESPALFYLTLKVFSQQSLEEVKDACLKVSFTDNEWAQLTIYLAAFLQNGGNYLSFGDNKFVPEVSRDKFWSFLKATHAFNLEPSKFTKIWEAIADEIYAFKDPFGHIGLIDLNGLSGYYSSNVTEEDAKLTQEFLESIKVSSLNTRVIKHSNDFFEIHVCSIKSGGKLHEFKNKKFSVVYGEFNVFMTKVVQNLKEALPFSENDTQKAMIKHYINHFITGDMELHKDSQREWIKDKGPIIETNIGFIEHYLDPMKYRGEWDGLVAVVNKEQSKLLGKLVDNAPDLLKKMPWTQDFEQKDFSKPDFTSLDVLTMATFDVPVGINLPNYDDIRTESGFKNVSLGNCYPTPSKKTATFVKEELLDTLMKFTQDGLFLQVSLHELLGHGSGKLMRKDKDGVFNWDTKNLKNPLNGELITTWYEDQQTFNTKFGSISSGYEECRADSIALYLSTFNESFEILLNEKKENWDDILFCTWYNILINGVRGLVFYNEAAKLWGQAHIAGRYAILQVCLEAGNNFVTIEETEKDGKPYLYLNLDRSQIRTTGRKAIGEYIKHLQIYKAIADVENGTKFFGKYTAVDEKFLKYRGIVLNFKTPRPINIQHDVEKVGDGFKYVRFDSNAEGVIKSHVYHHRDSFEDVYPLWLEKKEHFKPPKPTL